MTKEQVRQRPMSRGQTMPRKPIAPRREVVDDDAQPRKLLTADQNRTGNDSIRGTIKALKKAEGYGFVTHSATGEDYFFHRSQVVDEHVSFDELELDMAVVFTPSDGGKGGNGLRAQQLRVLD